MNNKFKYNAFYLILSIVIVFFLFARYIDLYEILSLSTFLFFIFKFTNDLGHELSIKNIIAIIAAMQWLLGPVFSYMYNDSILFGYQMSTLKSVYFTYALPATLAYFLGLYIPLRRSRPMLDFKKYPINYYQKGKFLIIIGFVLGLLPIGFLAYILGGLKYVGLFYMFASKNKFKYYWIALVFGMLGMTSLSNGMFHDIILWGSFFMMMYFLFRKASFVKKFTFMSLGLLIVMLIQFAKSDYRSALNSQTNTNNNIEIYWNVIKNKVFGNDALFSDENVASNITRINQGWIISRVLTYVPEKTPYANGTTIKDAIIASIFPRFLIPDKATAGGKLNMEKYAGITLNASTSMDISQIGEAYANFGILGGVFFMFLFGIFINWAISFIESKSIKYPDLIFWIPLIFLQAVKAETSLVTVLNHVAKTALVTWFFFSQWGDALINSKFTLKKKSNTLLN